MTSINNKILKRYSAPALMLAGIMAVQLPVLAEESTLLEDLPDGEGKTLLTSACVGCHTASNTLNARKTRQEWETTIYDMLSRGAQIFPDEIDTLVNYLSVNLAPEEK